MTRFSRSQLVVGAVGCVIVSVLIRAATQWLPGSGLLWQAVHLLLGVVPWFALVMGALLLLQAGGLSFGSFPGTARAAKAGVLLGAGIALGTAFVLGVATQYWYIFNGGQFPSFLSLVVDPLLGLLNATAGFLLALSCLALLYKRESPPDA